ncbi:MAG: hypothetical protein WAM82_09675 [Thermoanaerobaculia bacterium]
MPNPRRILRDLHRDLRARAADPEAWIYSALGADLWIDGLTAFRTVDEPTFDAYLEAYLGFAARAGDPIRSLNEGRPAALLGRFAPFLQACAEQGPRSFWPTLAVGLCLVRSLGGPPRLETGDELAILDDSLLFLVSPTYRGIRLAAYNTGLRTLAGRTGKSPTFRPEYGHFHLHPPSLIDAEPPRIPFYNYSHDLAHIVLFGDAYLRPVGTPETTASLLLNAEETVCTLDLVLAAELTRFGVHLHALTGLRKLESGSKVGKPSVTVQAAGDPDRVRAYQVALKAAAQLHLGTRSTVTERIVDSVDIPADLADWFDPLTQKMHASWAESLGRRVWHPVFQRLVSLLPPQPEHTANLLRFCGETFSSGRWIEEPLQEPCREARQKGILLYRLRFLVIRAAEAAVQLSADGLASEALLEDLTRWALALMDDLVRVQRTGATPEAEARVELHRAAVRELLVHHELAEAEELGGRFNDPVEPAYRSTQ